MQQAYNIFLLLGGIALFLFGINYMGDGIERAAGENLRNILQKLTTKSYMAVIIGALTTAVIQSSGATMVMVTGFVNAQLMNLTQALYVMLGATIGTTVTSQIIAFNIAPFAPVILFIGLALTRTFKVRPVKKAGEIILGFGLLFVGIYLMSEAVGRMNLGVLIEAFLARFSNPIIAFLFGLVFTLLIQSTSASVGILQVIVASAGMAFNLPFVYIVLGMNAGALSPLIISSIGNDSRVVKRTIVAEVISKLSAVLIFIILMLIFPGILGFVQRTSPEVSRQIANFHLLFNVVTAIAIFPLIGLIAKLGYKWIPDDPNEEVFAAKLMYVSDDIFRRGTPVILAQLHKEIIRFAWLCADNFKTSLQAFFTRDEELCNKVVEIEKNINYINHELNVYLVKVYAIELSPKDTERVGAMFSVISDFERIGDHAENIAEYAVELIENRAKISPEGLADIKRMADKTEEMIYAAMDIYDQGTSDLMSYAEQLEEDVDKLYDELLENHITRLKNNICEPRGGVIYTDLISDLERCSDHALNVAQSILGTKAPIE
ncbi:MAG: Na/Pi cotransporter family protein [Firmicutes bacterium]|nr:Na/Pi cotransporter family protein [Bacillota bacterium]